MYCLFLYVCSASKRLYRSFLSFSIFIFFLFIPSMAAITIATNYACAGFNTLFSHSDSYCTCSLRIKSLDGLLKIIRVFVVAPTLKYEKICSSSSRPFTVSLVLVITFIQTNFTAIENCFTNIIRELDRMLCEISLCNGCHFQIQNKISFNQNRSSIKQHAVC